MLITRANAIQSFFSDFITSLQGVKSKVIKVYFTRQDSVNNYSNCAFFNFLIFFDPVKNMASFNSF